MGIKSSWQDQHNRPDLAGEHRWGDLLQAMLFLGFLVVWIMDMLNWKTGITANRTFPIWLRLPLGGVLILISGYLAWAGIHTVFLEKRPQPEVIRHGVFALVRHPIYLGAILLYPGLVLIHLSLPAAAFIPAAVVLYVSLSRYEEKRLQARFGNAYSEYMREVSFLFPRNLRKRTGNHRGL